MALLEAFCFLEAVKVQCAQLVVLQSCEWVVADFSEIHIDVTNKVLWQGRSATVLSGLGLADRVVQYPTSLLNCETV